MTVKLRNTLILAAAVLVAGLVVGLLAGRPAAAASNAEAGAAGRYQIVIDVNVPPAQKHGNVVVLDTATGQCWSSEVGKEDWRDMGSPAKK
jgi:hypothetical protein